MKYLLLLLLLALCGCRTPAPVPNLPASTLPIPVHAQPAPTASSIPVARPVAPSADPKSRQQTQLIEALINQNEALTVRLAASQTAPASTEKVSPATPPLQVTPTMVPVPVQAPVKHTLAPNAEGVVDLTAIEQAGNANEPINPFAVRTAPDAKSREISLLVGGIILGKTPCAMVNGRLVQAGEALEGFEVERIESGAVIVRIGSHQLRLPVSTLPVRVKLAR